MTSVADEVTNSASDVEGDYTSLGMDDQSSDDEDEERDAVDVPPDAHIFDGLDMRTLYDSQVSSLHFSQLSSLAASQDPP